MRRKDGKIDRRSTAYKEAVDRMSRARRAMKKQRQGAAAKPTTAASSATARGQSRQTGRRRSDGGLDQRTAEGKAMAEKMAAMRAKRGAKKGVTRIFAWLFGG